MPTLTLEYRDDGERLALEQAIAYAAQEAPRRLRGASLAEVLNYFCGHQDRQN